MKMTKATLQSIVIYRPEPTIRLKRAHVHGQKATRFQRYTNYWKSMAIQIHIRLKGKKKAALKKEYQNTRARTTMGG